MDTPKIKINGKIVQPTPPKMKVWREFLAFFDEDKGKMTVEKFLSAHVALIVLAFKNSFGLTHFPGGDEQTLMRSVTQYILKLPQETLP